MKEPSNDLIKIVVTEQVDANPPGAAGPLNKEVPLDPGVAPLAESEESDQSSIDLDKLAKNEENEANKKDEEATLPRLQYVDILPCVRQRFGRLRWFGCRLVATF